MCEKRTDIYIYLTFDISGCAIFRIYFKNEVCLIFNVAVSSECVLLQIQRQRYSRDSEAAI